MGARANVCEHVCFDGVRDGVSQRVRGRKRRRRKENGEGEEWREWKYSCTYLRIFIHAYIRPYTLAIRIHLPTISERLMTVTFFPDIRSPTGSLSSYSCVHVQVSYFTS